MARLKPVHRLARNGLYAPIVYLTCTYSESQQTLGIARVAMPHAVARERRCHGAGAWLRRGSATCRAEADADVLARTFALARGGVDATRSASGLRRVRYSPIPRAPDRTVCYSLEVRA